MCIRDRDSNISKEEELTFPSNHDIISCLAVGAHWVTTNTNLQVSIFVTYTRNSKTITVILLIALIEITLSLVRLLYRSGHFFKRATELKKNFRS